MSRFDKLFKEADAAFDGIYKEELNELSGLSREEIDSVTPDTEDRRVYDKLIIVVKQASKQNLSKAELIGEIKELGLVAVKIAKKVPSLAALII
jgi:hypothetical protein